MARKGKKQVFYLDHMDKIIHISVKDGMATVDKCPKGCVILIKDYDTQDTDGSVHKKYKDADGEYTLEIVDYVNVNFIEKEDEKSK